MSTNPCSPRAPIYFGVLLSLAVTGMLLAPPVSGPPDGFVSPPTTFLPQEAGSDWWTQAHQHLAQGEYRISQTKRGLQAPNRAQNLRTYFRDGWIEVVPRDPGGDAWRWTWQTAAWGREGAMRPIRTATPIADGARVEYDHADLIEWYVNDEKGVEQGFTLHESPLGEGELRIEGTIGGDLTPTWTVPGAGLEFQNPSGSTVLRYSKLVAIDAEGRELDSRITLEDDLLCLSIDDTDAAYPLLIDPLLDTPDWSFVSDQIYDLFGESVATAGDINGDGYSDVIIGAPRYDSGFEDEGKAFLFLGSASGLQVNYSWSWGTGGWGAASGQSVATAGDVNGDGFDDVIIGAPENAFPAYGDGTAYVFHGSPSGLADYPDWSAGADEDTHYGYSVATAGDVNNDGYDDIVVGVPRYANGESIEGAFCLYLGSASGLSTYPDRFVESNDSGAYLGYSVSTAGDVNADGYDDVVVGAIHGGPDGDGAAFLYFGGAGGLEATPSWQTFGFEDYGKYGFSVSTAGDVNGDGYSDVLVGDPQWGGMTDERGAAYLYRGSASGLEVTPAWTFYGEQVAAGLGRSVATAGDVNGDGFSDIIIGAPNFGTGATWECGVAYVFFGNHGGPASEPDWMGEGEVVSSRFGSSVATAGDVNGDGYSDIIVGASFYYVHDQPDVGRAYLFHGGPGELRREPGWVTESNQELAQYGYAIAGAGDVNGDGFGDVLVSAPNYDNGQVDEGAVFLFLGTHLGLAVLPLWYAEGDQEDARFGTSVASAGDVNGDGFADILIGAADYDEGAVDGGAAFLWHGPTGSSPTGTPANADWAKYLYQEDGAFGYSVASAGDVDADGFADVIIGTPNFDWTYTDCGGVFIFSGSAGGLLGDPDWISLGDQDGAHYGISVSCAGDFNGDGYSDILIGAYKYDNPEPDEGKVFLHTGSTYGITGSTPHWTAESNQDGARMGCSVASAGDVNGDGFSDALIGASRYEGPSTPDDVGGAFVWYGNDIAPTDGNPDNADWYFLHFREGANLGYSVAGAGDVNADGYSDLLIGAPNADNLYYRQGIAGYVLGSWFGPELIMHVLSFDAQADADFGHCVAPVGDVNGDGFSDVMVGARGYDNGQVDEGRAFLYYGNDSRGLARIPQQWTNDFSALIAPGGTSDSETAFGLSAYARTAAGRGKVRMQTEVKRYRTPFDGTDIIEGSWVDTGAPSEEFGSVTPVLGYAWDLDVGRQYCWRVRFVTDSPFFPRSPWIHMPYNAVTEADLRMAGWTSDAPAELSVDRQLRLAPCMPNPFGSETTMSYSMREKGPVRLSVYDVQGRLVRTLVDRVQEAGTYTIKWDGLTDDGRPVGTGVYFTRLAAGGEEKTQRVVRTR